MEAVKHFEQLSHPTRLRTIALLLEGELCVCELETILNIRQANISKHLNKLKETGIVTVRREKQRGFYYLQDTFLQNETLIAHVKHLKVTSSELHQDYMRFMNHEQTKNQNIYVCNKYKEPLS